MRHLFLLPEGEKKYAATPATMAGLESLVNQIKTETSARHPSPA